jgi:hypothetical protein
MGLVSERYDLLSPLLALNLSQTYYNSLDWFQELMFGNIPGHSGTMGLKFRQQEIENLMSCLS